jgi:hypothetical protein
MSPLATVVTKRSVSDYIKSLEDESKRVDSRTLVKMMQNITGKRPKIWGDNNLIGFGKYTYMRKGKKEEFEWFHVGFAVRKANITLYLTCYLEKEVALLKNLGKYKAGKGCLYIKRLSDVDLKVLRKLIERNKSNRWGEN